MLLHTAWHLYCPWVSATITHLTCAVSYRPFFTLVANSGNFLDISFILQCVLRVGCDNISDWSILRKIRFVDPAEKDVGGEHTHNFPLALQQINHPNCSMCMQLSLYLSLARARARSLSLSLLHPYACAHINRVMLQLAPCVCESLSSTHTHRAHAHT